MKKVFGNYFFITLLSIIALVSHVDYVHGRAIKNESGKDHPVTVLRSKEGPFAKLFIKKGAVMGFDDNGDPNYGEGYYEALPGNYYFVPVTVAQKKYNEKTKSAGLHVDKIEWDVNGTTILIKNLRPFVETYEGKTPIISSVKNIKIENGGIYLTLKYIDGTTMRHKFTMSFGKGVSIEPPLGIKQSSLGFLFLSKEAIELSNWYIRHGGVTGKHFVDAQNIAIATIANVNVLVGEKYLNSHGKGLKDLKERFGHLKNKKVCVQPR